MNINFDEHVMEGFIKQLDQTEHINLQLFTSRIPHVDFLEKILNKKIQSICWLDKGGVDATGRNAP